MDRQYIYIVSYILGCALMSRGEYGTHSMYEHEQTPEKEDLKTLQVEHIFKAPLHLRISKSDDGGFSYEPGPESEHDARHEMTLGYSEWAAKEDEPTKRNVFGDEKKKKKREMPPSILSLLWPWYSKEQTVSVDQPKIIVEREGDPHKTWQNSPAKRKSQRVGKYGESKQWKGGVGKLQKPWGPKDLARQPEMSRPRMKEYIDGMGDSKQLPAWAQAPWQPYKFPWQPSKPALQPSKYPRKPSKSPWQSSRSAWRPPKNPWQLPTAHDVYKEPQGTPHRRMLHYPKGSSDDSHSENKDKDIPKVSAPSFWVILLTSNCSMTQAFRQF